MWATDALMTLAAAFRYQGPARWRGAMGEQELGVSLKTCRPLMVWWGSGARS